MAFKDPREVPHMKWREDGIGNIRLYHVSCPVGGKIFSNPQEYLEALKDGWFHCPENVPVPTLVSVPSQDQEPEKPRRGRPPNRRG